jgi:hypothetical protein
MDFWKKLLSVQILHDNSGDIGYKKRRRHDGVACSTIRVDMHLFIGSRRFDGLILGAPPLFSHCTLV